MRSIIPNINRAESHSIYKSGFFLLLLSTTFPAIHSSGREDLAKSLVLTNPASFSRTNEIVSISRKTLGVVSDHLFPVVKKGSALLITQLVDNDRDGRWEELLVAVSLPPHASDTLRLQWVKKNHLPEQSPVTNVRFSRKTKTGKPLEEISSQERVRGFVQNIADPVYQMEGPGIENDKVAFRAFFDYRNGKDVYGKTVPAPVLEEVGVTGSWHSLQPWGMDILRTGNSLGAGGLAVLRNGTMQRLADADTSRFTALYEGPLKAAFQLDFINWDGADGHTRGSERVSLAKGDYFYTNQVQAAISGDARLVAGIADFMTDTTTYRTGNEAFSALYTYGDQADGTKTKLGLAILIPRSRYAGQGATAATDSISNTSYIVMHPGNTAGDTVRFFACWEKTDSRFSTRQGFEQYIREVADRLAYPIRTSIIHHSNK